MGLPPTSYTRNEIRGQKEIAFHNLNAGVAYYFTVDAFNDSGRAAGMPQIAR
jgi:hypothetical protein